jgi:hypothetical protein
MCPRPISSTQATRCPSVDPTEFATVWHLIFALLRPGGHVSGQHFGDRDDWASNPDTSFQTRKDAYKRWPVPIFVAGAYVRIVTEDGQLLRS